MIKRILAIFSSIFMFGNCTSKPQPAKPWEQGIEKMNPTQPINFGYKCVWVAVKTENTNALIEALNLKDVKKANWVEGIIKREPNQTFILPPINGWTLVLGGLIPIPDHSEGIEKTKSFLNNLSLTFGEAQTLGSHRVVSFAVWMKSINGELQRLYCTGDGKTFIEGVPTEIEKQWELFDEKEAELKGDDYIETVNNPDESDVLVVAEAWSINPIKLEEMKNIGTFGHLGIYKK